MTHGAYDFAADARGYPGTGARVFSRRGKCGGRLSSRRSRISSRWTPGSSALRRPDRDRARIRSAERPGKVRFSPSATSREWRAIRTPGSRGSGGRAPDSTPCARSSASSAGSGSISAGNLLERGLFAGRAGPTADRDLRFHGDRPIALGRGVGERGAFGRAGDTLGIAYARNAFRRARDYLARRARILPGRRGAQLSAGTRPRTYYSLNVAKTSGSLPISNGFESGLQRRPRSGERHLGAPTLRVLRQPAL